MTFGYAIRGKHLLERIWATLTFTVVAADTEATFTVTTVEDGANKLGKVETVTMMVPEHDYLVTVVEATLHRRRLGTLYTCRNCGHHYRDQLTEALGHTWGA
ncbi:MAG: hypothetical protein ACLU9S_10360 [Oscillospiraceae bacterium]